MLSAFITGLILAIGLILPLGVQNTFLFNQGATQKKLWHALPSVLMACFCDTVLIAISVLGVSILVLHSVVLQKIMYCVGTVFLIYMGFLSWKNKIDPQAPTQALSIKQQTLFAASVSLLNPHAFLDSMAVIGANALRFTGAAKWSFATACILVSYFWFFSLTILGHCIKQLDKNAVFLNALQKISALIIWGIAIYFIWQFYLLS